MALIKFTDTSASPETLVYVTNDIKNYGVVGQADVPGLTADQQQRKMEEIQRKVIMPLINANIDDTCAVSIYDNDADGRVDGADEADTLTTARTINLTDADGTNTGTSASFDGSADVTLKLPAAIKANVTGAVTGNVTGDVSGNAGTATQLATARTLTVQDYGGTHSGAGVSFDGTANATMKLPSTIAANFIGDVNGNAASADKWKTSRNFTIKDADSTNSGAAVSMDGSASVTLNLPSTIKATITGDVTGNLTGDVTGNVAGNVTGNLTGDASGNAGTASKLAAARTLNITDADATNTGTGASFDGSAAATIKLPATIKASLTGNASTSDKWKTARNLTIKDADATNSGVAASVDGSAAVTLNLPSTIKASITGNVSGSAGSCTGNAATATALATARNITIGSKTNSFDGSAAVTYTLADIGAAAASHSHAESDVTDLVTHLAAKLPLSGGTLTGALTLAGAPTVDLHAATKKYVDDTVSAAGGGDMMKTAYDSNSDGTVNAADTAATATKLAATKAINISDADATNTGTAINFDGSANGTIKLPATIKATISGNASTATKLAATKNITVGSKTNAFDGSADITFSLADVGAAAASHAHGNINSDGTIVSGDAGDILCIMTTGGLIESRSRSSAGVADRSHTHGNLTNDGKIGSTSGLIVTTGTAGAVGVQTKLEADIAELDANDKVKADEASARIVAVTASKTLALTDAGTLQKCTNSTAATITIPANSSVAFPIGTEIEFVMYGDGTVTIDGTAVTMHSADSYDTVSTKYKSCAIKQMATDEWLLTGAEE